MSLFLSATNFDELFWRSERQTSGWWDNMSENTQTPEARLYIYTWLWNPCQSGQFIIANLEVSNFLVTIESLKEKLIFLKLKFTYEFKFWSDLNFQHKI